VAKDRTEFAQENMQRTMNAASFGANWMAEMTEQSLHQSMAAVDGMLTLVRRAADGFTQQATAIREQSVALAEQAMGNTAEFGTRMARLRDPLEWAEAQSEFLSKQAQTLAEGNRRLGEILIQQSTEVADATLHQARETTRKRAEAA
jgi:phasin family protein